MPWFGLTDTFRNVHNYALIGRNTNLAGPDILVSALYGHLIGARRNNKLLLPPQEIGIELVAMANEEVWSLPIKQDGISVGTLDGNGAERT